MGPGFPFGGESTGVGAGPMVNTGAGMPGAGGEDVGFGGVFRCSVGLQEKV